VWRFLPVTLTNRPEVAMITRQQPNEPLRGPTALRDAGQFGALLRYRHQETV